MTGWVLIKGIGGYVVVCVVNDGVLGTSGDA